MSADVLYQKLADAVVDMDEDGVVVLAQQAVDENVDAFEAIDKGLAKGMERVGDLFEDEEYFVPELIVCADTMDAGIGVLKPHLKPEALAGRHKAIIGVVQGDTHDIGKNLVKILLEASGFELIDLGRDVPPVNFVEKAVETDAELILLSSLMTTTMEKMSKVVDLAREKGVRDKIKILVGGGPVSQAFSDRIGADGYAKNAAEAVRLCQKLVTQGVK
ncbi:MAG: corrinoid protein [Treponema sp.]|jgi:corrinoid protein of di/trimethylamine methyltransferase|nr:corrinoid protein [Treponema sp.]